MTPAVDSHVLLVSGGPVMLVVETAPGYALCQWGDGRNWCGCFAFPVECLTLLQP